ncbi:carboxylate-amine ligase [Silanimonas algicola]
MPGPVPGTRMSIDFPYTFGIEEEFFLVSPRTRGLMARVPKAYLNACRARLGEVVAPELLQSQIEVATRVLSDFDEAARTLDACRSGLADVAEAMNYRLVAAGTHPSSHWSGLEATEKPRYARLMADFGIVGRRNVLCGLHVHVAVPPGVDRVVVMNGVMRWLPVFLALSTSSPFWNRHVTGLLSYRQAAYDEWPRTGIPEFFRDQTDYDAFVSRLVQAGALRDASFLWWAIRPALRYPTLELRIADACTRAEDTLIIAALYRCLVRALVRDPSLAVPYDGHTRRVIDENRWRAKRDGMEAQFIDERDGRVRPLTEWLDDLLALTAPDRAALGADRVLGRLPTLLARGSSAHAQLQAYQQARDGGAGHDDALRAVVDWLVSRTTQKIGSDERVDTRG